MMTLRDPLCRRPSRQALIGILYLLSAASPALHAGDEWPQWRGPDGQGHASDAGDIPAEWSEEKNIRWKTKVPGRGHSSPVISGDEIWLTTAYEIEETDEAILAERLKANTGDQPLILLKELSLRAVGIDRNTGQILRNVELLNLKEPQWVHAQNSYASPTPVLEDGRLYCHFGAFGNACLDTQSGKVLWTNTDLQVMHENGPGSSPVLWQNLMIFHLDGSDAQWIVALDKHTGEVAWQKSRSGELKDNPQLRKSYATPILVEDNGRPCLVSPAADWLYGYDPATGEELWKVNYGLLGFSNVARPVAGHGMIYVPSGFMKSEMLAVRYGGESPALDEVAQPEIEWRHTKGTPKTPSPILVGDELYFISDSGGIVSCLDAHTGTIHWQERVDGNFSSSPLFANGLLYFFSREGETVVIEPSKDALKIVARNPLDDPIFASAAALDGALYLRTEGALYRIEHESESENKKP